MTESLQPTRCARLLGALADPERLRIVQFLSGGARHVSELASLLGSKIVNVSHHLGVLRHAGLVLDERQGRFVNYRLHPDFFRVDDSGRATALDFGCCRLEIPSDKTTENAPGDDLSVEEAPLK